MFLPLSLREKTSFEDILRPAPIEAREAIRAIKDRERLWELYETRIWPAWIVDRPTCLATMAESLRIDRRILHTVPHRRFRPT